MFNLHISICFEGAYIDDESSADLNIDLGGGTLGSTGNNTIQGNTGVDIRVDLDGDTLKAEGNWWGNAAGLQPAQLQLDEGSNIDATPSLTSAP